MLEGLTGVDVIADDIICYGSGDTLGEVERDHDQNIIMIIELAM